MTEGVYDHGAVVPYALFDSDNKGQVNRDAFPPLSLSPSSSTIYKPSNHQVKLQSPLLFLLSSHCQIVIRSDLS